MGGLLRSPILCCLKFVAETVIDSRGTKAREPTEYKEIGASFVLNRYSPSERHFDAVDGGAFLDELETFHRAFGLQMLEEFFNDGAGVELDCRILSAAFALDEFRQQFVPISAADAPHVRINDVVPFAGSRIGADVVAKLERLRRGD